MLNYYSRIYRAIQRAVEYFLLYIILFSTGDLIHIAFAQRFNLNMNAHLSSNARDLNVRWSIFLLPYSMFMVSEGSGDTGRMFAYAISTKISCTSLSIYKCVNLLYLTIVYVLIM